LLPYLLTGGVLWFFMLQSGVHATVAGILLAFFIPLRTRNAADEVPLDRLEHAINPWVTFMILPLFAFANAGVALSGMTMNDLLSPVPVGVALG
ncbi:TPA: Na(+)/H(+) antiporter NhaA, partial [Klebsiella pneumoniae]|nr:Na(+)/H(+) antiporter NhaA [Klebsiella pneumoniae]